VEELCEGAETSKMINSTDLHNLTSGMLRAFALILIVLNRSGGLLLSCMIIHEDLIE
jgi:hypothetical protein